MNALIPALVLAFAAAPQSRNRVRDSFPAGSSSDQEPRYLLFWRSVDQAPELVRAIGEKGDGRTRLLGFGLPCSTIEDEKQVPERIHSAFAAARKHDLAVMLHFDFHVAWQNRPDLWNWFDPQKPGFNPENKRNVEWFGWEGPPAKVRYLNWGVPERIAPPMCYTSKAIRAEWTRLIRKVIAPPLKEELAALEREGKERLFAGVLVGSEPTFDDYSRPDPETAKMLTEYSVKLNFAFSEKAIQSQNASSRLQNPG
jgi:hypothetical protein